MQTDNTSFTLELFKMWLTLALTSLLAVLILASQKAPRYLALTSVPTVKYGGSSKVWGKRNKKRQPVIFMSHRCILKAKTRGQALHSPGQLRKPRPDQWFIHGKHTPSATSIGKQASKGANKKATSLLLWWLQKRSYPKHSSVLCHHWMFIPHPTP